MPRRPDTVQRNIVAHGPAKESVRAAGDQRPFHRNGWLTAGRVFVLWKSDIIRPSSSLKLRGATWLVQCVGLLTFTGSIV